MTYIGAAQLHDILFENCNFIECFRTCCFIMHSAAMNMVTWVAFTYLVTTKTKIRCGTNLRTVVTIITRRACYKSEDYNAQQSRHINKFSQIIKGMHLSPTYVILYNIPLSNLRFLNREVVYTKIVICSKLCYTSLHEICVL